ncbi:alpha DNA polymerase [Coprinopsis cinerea okayama7|uniref:DNA polymerase alpha subunit B n=1 Tax=Coprinopsis cinerea (strain Okayama-7 / 130 / ATCC MYA-4618 / FGSC 9003) TaxID=240176 RepID=A8NRD8_COPC7|nr:alpha DNA polymerase [Coprinopsis cinerea okayama7\|eukprot:XP_001835762.1 alpha DNA polymerase [Coprinopsis cinerea okayama7\
MDSKLRKLIEATYPESVTSDEAVVNECVSICSTYNLDPSDLQYKLEAMNYKATNTRTEILPITLETLRTFRTQLQRGLANESMKRAQLKARPGATASVDRSRLPSQLMNQARAMDIDRPGPSSASSSSSPMQVKKEAAGITLSLGPTHVLFEGAKMDSESRKARAYRYMYEKISERSEVLDQIIDDFAELIRDHYDISELADPSSTTEEEVTVVGRIAQDPDVMARSKLTESSMVIESSRMLSSGARVPLRLDPAIQVKGAVQGSRGYGLFPGQIVALQGKNGGGGYFYATTILAIPPLKPSPTSDGLIDPKADPELGTKTSTVCIACGPYTSDTDLLYKPWRVFLDDITPKKPNVLILLGPFIDAAHPRIKNGESETSPQSIFQARFINSIRKFLNASPSSIVIFIPSIRDMISDHCSFPQPEFERTFDGIAGDSRIIFQPNPCRFKINDISFGATSVDVLFHLRKEEYLKVGSQLQPIPAREGDLASDPMSNLCRHLLDQRSFYPIFPVPEELSHEINLDVSHLDGARIIDDGEIDYAPDVLIVPSRLRKFDKVVSTTLAINPSSVSKGSYVLLNIGSKSGPTNLRERLKAELQSIEIPAAAPVKTEPSA